MKKLLLVLLIAGYVRLSSGSVSGDVADEICSATDGSCTISDEIETVIPKGANAEGRPVEAPVDCIDRHDQCVGFAEQGECTKNPGWMIVNCPFSCQACHLRDAKVRCPRKTLNISESPIYAPGDMHAMFSRLKDEFDERYNVTIHSTSPWVVTFENFMTPAETSAIIRVVDKWERSTDTGQSNQFGETGRVLSQGRTSTNAWCRERCEADPHVQNVMKKIEEVTRVPSDNYESFQILRYEKGQEYRAHHDYGYQQKFLACGPRILTFFLYLSDVEEGGETAFTNLNIKVKPKRGRALLWPSTLDSDPEAQEPGTHHAALPVIKGVKYAANAWIHLYNFRIPNLWGCTGTFDVL